MVIVYILNILYIYISGHKWSTTHRVLKSHRSKMSITYMLSWKQCALPVITTMTLWQLMHLGTWCTVHHVLKIIIGRASCACKPYIMPSHHKAIVVITGRKHCFHDNIYIMFILLLWDLSILCVVDHLWPLILKEYKNLSNKLCALGFL